MNGGSKPSQSAAQEYVDNYEQQKTDWSFKPWALPTDPLYEMDAADNVQSQATKCKDDNMLEQMYRNNMYTYLEQYAGAGDKPLLKLRHGYVILLLQKEHNKRLEAAAKNKETKTDPKKEAAEWYEQVKETYIERKDKETNGQYSEILREDLQRIIDRERIQDPEAKKDPEFVSKEDIYGNIAKDAEKTAEAVKAKYDFWDPINDWYTRIKTWFRELPTMLSENPQQVFIVCVGAFVVVTVGGTMYVKFRRVVPRVQA